MFGSHSAPPESQVRTIPSGENFCKSAISRLSTSASQAACNGRWLWTLLVSLVRRQQNARGGGLVPPSNR